MANEATVFIIDDDDEVREALQLLMQSIGLHCETYPSAQSYLDAFNINSRGCLVLDVRMKGMSGLALQSHLATFPLHPPIIMITGHGDISMAVQALQAGALDFLEKPFNEQSLLESIYRAIEKDAQQRGEASKTAEIHQRIARLTSREKEVMEEVVSGKRNKVIAYDLEISQSTVEAHRAKVMEKMEAASLSDLMRMIFSIKD
ncbi:MAG: response regulator transcription factor [Cocleimonas sp.]|nr:response regulator transcription factor [Cocleimonas sp.]